MAVDNEVLRPGDFAKAVSWRKLLVSSSSDRMSGQLLTIRLIASRYARCTIPLRKEGTKIRAGNWQVPTKYHTSRPIQRVEILVIRTVLISPNEKRRFDKNANFTCS